jgi:hypothetical protein
MATQTNRNGQFWTECADRAKAANEAADCKSLEDDVAIIMTRKSQIFLWQLLIEWRTRTKSVNKTIAAFNIPGRRTVHYFDV